MSSRLNVQQLGQRVGTQTDRGVIMLENRNYI